MRQAAIAWGLSLVVCAPLWAQRSAPGPEIFCPAGHGDAHTSLPRFEGQGGGRVPSTFEVRYEGFPAPAERAFQQAVDLWANRLTTTVPIRVSASWEALAPNVLGSARPTTIEQNFPNAPAVDVWYPVALAEKLAGEALNTSAEPDIEVRFNSEIDWYFGLDARPGPGQYDLVSVVLHELGHGLGFISTARRDNDNDELGAWGLTAPGGSFPDPLTFDNFIESSTRAHITDPDSFSNPSRALLDLYTGNELFLRVSPGSPPFRLHAPPTFTPGSSVAHWDEATYPAGDPNSLMTPQIAPAEAVHQLGPHLLRTMQAIGWTDDLPPLPALSVLPNRVFGRETVLVLAPFREDVESAQIVVYDVQGRRVLTRQATVTDGLLECEIPVTTLSTGLYVVGVQGDGEVRHERLIVLR